MPATRSGLRAAKSSASAAPEGKGNDEDPPPSKPGGLASLSNGINPVRVGLRVEIPPGCAVARKPDAGHRDAALAEVLAQFPQALGAAGEAVHEEGRRAFCPRRSEHKLLGAGQDLGVRSRSLQGYVRSERFLAIMVPTSAIRGRPFLHYAGRGPWTRGRPAAVDEGTGHAHSEQAA